MSNGQAWSDLSTQYRSTQYGDVTFNRDGCKAAANVRVETLEFGECQPKIERARAKQILPLTAVNARRQSRLGHKPMSGRQIMAKNIFDRLLSITLLVLASPMMALIALAVRLDSRGPLLFRQPRIGLHDTMFTIYKFRTMHAHMADIVADRQVTRGDPRVTRVGRILRRTSLDELPQLLNVVRGEMSLVGPRPHAPNTKAGDKLFHEVVADYKLRHQVKPGITGWAQVNGLRGETRTYQQIERRIAYDLYYIEHWSLWFDLKILLMTAHHQITSEAAY